MTTINQTLALVLAAAGSSSRMGLGKKKEYLELNGGTVLSEAASVFLKTARFKIVAVTIPEGDEENARKALYSSELVKNAADTNFIFVPGGSTRQDSVKNALECIEEHLKTDQINVSDAVVLIHDGARPFVTEKIISDTINAAIEHGAAVPAMTPVDTQKEIKDNRITRHLVRKNLAAVQTPQGFLLEPLIKCHRAASEKSMECTDDTEIWDSFPEFTTGRKVYVVEGDSCNKKITYAQDIIAPDNKEGKMIRIGMGTDLHQLVEGRKLFLGGVEIPSDKGELGHSDGDALLHAISDALLGAAGMGDIGSYFPPEDSKWKDADSKILLKKTWDDVRKKGWKLNNLDCVIEIEKPKFLPWRCKVIESIASVLEVDPSLVFVKAKTNEKQDSVGRRDALKTYCVCLLSRD